MQYTGRCPWSWRLGTRLTPHPELCCHGNFWACDTFTSDQLGGEGWAVCSPGEHYYTVAPTEEDKEVAMRSSVLTVFAKQVGWSLTQQMMWSCDPAISSSRCHGDCKGHLQETDSPSKWIFGANTRGILSTFASICGETMPDLPPTLQWSYSVFGSPE